MAREVILRTWCDPCLADEQHQEGVELPPLQLFTGKPRVIALCEVHRKELFDPLVELLREHGQSVDADGSYAPSTRGHYKPRATAAAAIAAGEALSCPAKDCDHQSPNRSALSAHVRSMHDTTLGVLEGQDAQYQCPECDDAFTSPQGLGAHRNRRHGVVGTSGPAKAASPADRTRARRAPK